MNKIRISDLWVSQEGLRNTKQLQGLVQFYQKQKVLKEENLLSKSRGSKTSLVHIIKMNVDEDNWFYMIHNGHHRAVAALLAGKTFFEEGEFILEESTIDHYLEFNPPHWLTPYDPLVEVRVTDLEQFKYDAGVMYMLHGKETAREYVNSHQKDYLRERTITFVTGLAEQVVDDWQHWCFSGSVLTDIERY